MYWIKLCTKVYEIKIRINSYAKKSNSNIFCTKTYEKFAQFK